MGPKKLDPSLIWEIPKRKHFCSGFQPLVSIVFLGGARCNNIHLYYPTLSTYIAVCSFFQRLHPSIYPISDPILSAKSLGRTFCPPIKDPSQEEGRKQLDRILVVVTERGYPTFLTCLPDFGTICTHASQLFYKMRSPSTYPCQWVSQSVGRW